MEIPNESWIKIITGQEHLLEGFKDMKKKFDGLHKDLHEPDDGIYARVRKNTEFRKSAKKWLWGMAVMVFSWTGKALYEFFKGK